MFDHMIPLAVLHWPHDLNEQALICLQEYSGLMVESSNSISFWTDQYYWSGGN